MKTLFFSFVCLFALFSQAQTAIISHKSHSGNASDFLIDPSTNFGIPSPRLVQVIRLNDSTSIEVSDHYNGYYSYDTIYKNPVYSNYHLNIDSIKEKQFHSNVEYINFKMSPKSSKQKPVGYDTKRINEQTPTEIKGQPKQEITPQKKKKRSALLFLVLFTGGGLILFRILSRIFRPSIAA